MPDAAVTAVVKAPTSMSHEATAAYDEITAHKEDLLEQGIRVVESDSRGMTGIEEGIVVAIVGGVATNYVVKLIDFLVGRLRKNRAYETTITIVHEEAAFSLPERTRECKQYFNDRAVDQDGG